MRKIITTSAFDKSFTKISRKNTTLQLEIISCLKLLAADVHDPKLKTHKLSGNISQFYSCSVNYSIRIIFKFDSESVYLQTLGTHDNVY